MINEKQVQYLLTVAETGNITAAARKLYISQPALSRMILDLEHSLGVSLFIRDRGNLHLSQAGEVYLSGCRDVLAIQNSVLKKLSDLRDSQSGQLTLGVTTLTGEYIIPLILDAFSAKFPGIELVLIEERMNMLRELVKSGKADLAITYQKEDPALEYSLILENPVYLQVPPTFWRERMAPLPAAKRKQLLPELLNGQTFILLKKGRGMREVADQLLSRFQIEPGKIMETDNIHLAKSLVRLDKGFTLVPDISIRRSLHPSREADHYCQVKDYPIKRSLYCCYRKSGYLTEAESYIIKSLPHLLK